jgi:hypothetical protein
MEIVADKRDKGIGRRVYEIRPYPNTNPEFVVGMYRLLGNEGNRLWDKHDYNPVKGGPAGSQSKAQQVLEDNVRDAVAYIKGASFNGQPMSKEHEDFIYFMLEQDFEDERDGKLRDLWTICNQLLMEQVKVIAKNSRKSSPGSGATDSQNANS